MTDNMTPQLTLDPTAAAAEAVPTLTLTPEAPEAPQVEEEKKIEPVEMDEKLLTDAEKKAVEDFSHKIDIRDTNMILQYGAAVSSGMGTCGLVGQIGVYTGWVSDIAAGTKAAITPMDWAAMVLLCFVLPAVLSVIFCEIERKLGWIKEGDLKLN